ncbi:pilus assembly protein PilZ [Geomonas ferrireducens]|uniref:pilus assembly protein PilZ n=1 Tax=Geomonas ferrireducens TaxID=2570227 RepID=UPI0010A91DCF|nr:pilus assembly protein PilZ [Geomonas ferrireducens]
MGDAVPRLHVVPSDAESPATGKSVSRSYLVNRLNYINFQNQSILVALRHVAYDESIFLKAMPLPCAGERLDCLWEDVPSLRELLKSYRFDFLLIADGRKYLVVNPEPLTIDDCGFALMLPPACREFQARRIRRHLSDGVSAQIMQNGVLFDGSLVDYTPVSLRISGTWEKPETLRWINTEEPVHLRLFRGETMLYSGVFDVHAMESAGGSCSFVLSLRHSSIRRFKPKKYRNFRQELVPTPNVVFNHPLIGKRVNLMVTDMSGTGFSIQESEGDSLLMPGLMIPGLKITFGHGMSLCCLAQVLSRNPSGEKGDEKLVRCGLAILDMAIGDHVKLLSLLHQVTNRKSYVDTEVDLDDLWDFFFQTGFIYPEKYAHFQENKEKIKETYARLYSGNPQIARHFIYLDHGVILGHLAMVRFYSNSWLIHHHAARKSAAKAGIAVLDQVSHYLSELESFAFARLRYAFCYYRPDNRFPARVFGGFAAKHADQRSCSLDLFAYFHYQNEGGGEDLPPQWELSKSSAFDLSEMGSFYRHVSGGALIEAFDLCPGGNGDKGLAREYNELGFRKEVHLYSLRRKGSLKAFFLVNCTDAGFNMAELTNCVTIFVIDYSVPRALVEMSLRHVSRHYEGGAMPALVFPHSYAVEKAFPVEKTYLLWILDMRYTDHFLHYCDGLLKGPRKAQ